VPLPYGSCAHYDRQPDKREEIVKRSIAIVLTAVFAAGGAAAQDVKGTWLSQTGETRVRIAPCGAALCGTVVWQKAPGKDEKNPDAAKRNRNIVGIQMIFGMKPSGGAEWTGQLYNFQDGKTYTGKMTLAGPNALSLSGCIAGGLICRAQTWSRVN
jgi:uncharacterized protein (DUF2147 family)